MTRFHCGLRIGNRDCSKDFGLRLPELVTKEVLGEQDRILQRVNAALLIHSSILLFLSAPALASVLSKGLLIPFVPSATRSAPRTRRGQDHLRSDKGHVQAHL